MSNSTAPHIFHGTLWMRENKEDEYQRSDEYFMRIVRDGQEILVTSDDLLILEQFARVPDRRVDR